ncbi:MAG: DNA/RNA nuclease SfsA [Desulfosudaceae bacterium]
MKKMDPAAGSHDGKERPAAPTAAQLPPGGLFWPSLVSGTLVKRYQRFLADVRLDDGKIVTAHCPNSGSMQACAEPGRPVYLSQHDNPRRKLAYTGEIIDMPTSLVGVNTQVPNRLVARAIADDVVPELTGYDIITREVRAGERSRLDLLLTAHGRRPCYVEVKNCTLVSQGQACFPDAVTTRGRRHLEELQRLAAGGSRGVIFFLIQRMDADIFQPADHIDREYGRALRQAGKKGVEILVYDVSLTLAQIALNRPVICRL